MNDGICIELILWMEFAELDDALGESASVQWVNGKV